LKVPETLLFQRLLWYYFNPDLSLGKGPFTSAEIKILVRLKPT